jgi:phosphoheptose isomerase
MTQSAVDAVRAIFETISQPTSSSASTRLETVVAAAEAVGRAVESGRTIIAFGNGGSAADAQHSPASSSAASKPSVVRWLPWRCRPTRVW